MAVKLKYKEHVDHHNVKQISIVSHLLEPDPFSLVPTFTVNTHWDQKVITYCITVGTIIRRSYKRRRCLKANKYCAFWISLAVISAVAAVLVFALIETTANYQESAPVVFWLENFHSVLFFFPAACAVDPGPMESGS
jgi:hypothetical protein